MTVGEAHEVANRLKADQRIVVQLFQKRIDEKRISIYQQSVPIRRCARRSFRSDCSARPWAVVDYNGRPLRSADLLGQ